MRGELLALSLDYNARRTRTHRNLETAQRSLAASGKHLQTGFTGQELVILLRNKLGKFVDAAVDSTLRGKRTTLPSDLFGACATSSIESRPLWDPGFEVDASIRARTVVGTRLNSPAYHAGLRDSMIIMRASIARNDPTKLMSLRVRGRDGEKEIEYSPASETRVSVQQFALVCEQLTKGRD